MGENGYQSNESGYQTETILPAIVNTIGYEFIQNQIIMTAEILHKSESNYNGLEFGFLISPNVVISASDTCVQKLWSPVENEGLFSARYISLDNQTLYFKAFVENSVGISYGRTLKISGSQETDPSKMNPSERALDILNADSLEKAGGWFENSWFGSYKAYESGWIYHSTHGWLYLFADTENGIWAWSDQRGWVWSTKEVYPFLYQSNQAGWIYFMKKKDNVIYYYNFLSKSLERSTP